MNPLLSINFNEHINFWYRTFVDSAKEGRFPLKEASPHVNRVLTHAIKTKAYADMSFIVGVWSIDLETIIKPHIRRACLEADSSALSILIQGAAGRHLPIDFVADLFDILAARNHVACIKVLAELVAAKITDRLDKEWILVRTAREASAETFLLLVDLLFPEADFALPCEVREKIIIAGNLELLEGILKKNDTLIPEYSRYSDLGSACISGRYEAAKCLLKFIPYPTGITYEIYCDPMDEKARDPTDKEVTFHTLLAISVIRKNIELAWILIQHGADPSHPSEKKARTMIKNQSQTDFLKLFFMHGCQISQFVAKTPRFRTERVAGTKKT
jgi:hypothetical protein